MTQQEQHSDDLFLITRDELDRCCDQMSAAGYKVSANYVEALVLSRPHIPAAPSHLSPDDRGWEQGFQDGQASALVDLNVHAATIRNQTLEEIEDKCVTYPSDLGDMILLSDVQSLRHQSTEAPK